MWWWSILDSTTELNFLSQKSFFPWPMLNFASNTEHLTFLPHNCHHCKNADKNVQLKDSRFTPLSLQSLRTEQKTEKRIAKNCRQHCRLIKSGKRALIEPQLQIITFVAPTTMVNAMAAMKPSIWTPRSLEKYEKQLHKEKLTNHWQINVSACDSVLGSQQEMRHSL